MSRRHETDGMAGGSRRQSAVTQRTGKGDHALVANGLKLRGAVLTTYVSGDLDTGVVPNVYCDVIVFSSMEGMRNQPLYQVPVMQSLGMHSGHIWKPRASTVHIGGASYALAAPPTDPQRIDGDHVLVEFLDNDLAKPVITGRIPHPQMDIGNEDRALGHRMRLQVVDGDPLFWKHHGSFFGFDKDGNFELNTTRAQSGVILESGAEEDPSDDAEHGNVTLRLNSNTTLAVVGTNPDGAETKFELSLKNGELRLRLDNGASLLVVGKDGNAVTTLGNGAMSVALAEHLEILWAQMVTAFGAHTHSVPVPPNPGPSVIPTGSGTPIGGLPSFAAAIKSSKLRLPDG